MALPPSSTTFLGTSPATRALEDFVRRAASVDVPVVLTGETGTGKSMAARAIHAAGPRSDAPFVVVNCAGIPEPLFESELFGHEKGAFTGAVGARVGMIEAADGGTLFLDELGELPPGQQGKLLLALESGRIRRVGSSRERGVDVRFISGTGRDLETALDTGMFRRDLFHRLAVLRHRLRPLRERPDDLMAIARDALRRSGLRHGFRRPAFTADAEAWLLAHPWPGNVRELTHCIEAAVILGGCDRIGPDILRLGAAGGSEAA